MGGSSMSAVRVAGGSSEPDLHAGDKQQQWWSWWVMVVEVMVVEVMVVEVMVVGVMVVWR